jgi:phosphopantothenoylcysteine synthetase/decarboxylase
MQKSVCITCGPAYEPVDGVRRLTNFSTGEIGAVLSAVFLKAGWRVLCLRGEGATFPMPAGIDVLPFSTNRSVEALFRGLSVAPDAVFHAAALGDFVVGGVEGAAGRKLESRSGEVLLRLSPAPKVLPVLRDLFPDSYLVGWKYELDGGRGQALARGRRQIEEARTDACVVNGAAFGSGFGLLGKDGSLVEYADKAGLAAGLVESAMERCA